MLSKVVSVVVQASKVRNKGRHHSARCVDEPAFRPRSGEYQDTGPRQDCRGRIDDLATEQATTDHVRMVAPPVFEIPVDDPGTARLAAVHADRLEVCRDLQSEGLTPSPELVREVFEHSRIAGRSPAISVLFQEIPPPKGRTLVTPADFAARPQDLACLARLAPEFARVGADSIVVGFVDAAGLPDVRAVGTAVEIAAEHGLEIAFHRAFDLADDPAEAARLLVDLGVARTLAAGVPGYALDGVSIHQRVERLGIAASAVSADGIGIVPCGGIRSGNAMDFRRITPHIHASCRRGARDARSGEFDDREAATLRTVVHRDRP